MINDDQITSKGHFEHRFKGGLSLLLSVLPQAASMRPKFGAVCPKIGAVEK